MSEWINVKDRLPENEKFVLVCNADDAEPQDLITISLFFNKKFFATEHDNNSIYEYVTHWMPLPEPPAK